MGIPEPTDDVARQRAQFRRAARMLRRMRRARDLPSTRCRWGCRPISKRAIAEGRDAGARRHGDLRSTQDDRTVSMNITFIGGGNMATALIGGLVSERRRRARIPRRRAAARAAGQAGRHAFRASASSAKRPRARSTAPTSSCSPSSRSRCARPRRRVAPYVGRRAGRDVDRGRRAPRRPLALARRLSAHRARDAQHAGADRRGHQRRVRAAGGRRARPQARAARARGGRRGRCGSSARTCSTR